MVQSRAVYFGYGSNMWRDQMVRRCPQHKYLGIAYITDWKWFICDFGAANIKKSCGDKAYGLVYELSKADEQTLDKYEGVPVNYTKQYHSITLLGTKSSPQESEVDALIYISDHFLKESPPKEEYIYRMNMAIADAVKEGVPEEYMEKYLRPFIPSEYKVPDGK